MVDKDRPDDTKFRIKISFHWEKLDGTGSGSTVLTDDIVDRQLRYAYEEALGMEVLRWGRETLRGHGIEPMKPEDAGKRGRS